MRLKSSYLVRKPQVHKYPSILVFERHYRFNNVYLFSFFCCTDEMPDAQKIPQIQTGSSPPDSAKPTDDHITKVKSILHPDPLYNLHLDTPHDLKKGSPAPKQTGHQRGLIYPLGMRSTTSSLPRFLPEGHRRFTPDPRLLPGESCGVVKAPSLYQKRV